MVVEEQKEVHLNLKLKHRSSKLCKDLAELDVQDSPLLATLAFNADD